MLAAIRRSLLCSPLGQTGPVWSTHRNRRDDALISQMRLQFAALPSMSAAYIDPEEK
jgi:hypothetical protein